MKSLSLYALICKKLSRHILISIVKQLGELKFYKNKKNVLVNKKNDDTS